MMRFCISILVLLSARYTLSLPLPTVASDIWENPNYYSALADVVNTDYNFLNLGGVWSFLQKIKTGNLWAQGIVETVVELIIFVFIPIMAFIGIVYAIIGFFKIMGAPNDEELKKWWNFLIWWVIGVLVMIVAAWIVNILVWSEGVTGVLGDITQKAKQDVAPAVLAGDLYRILFYPLIRFITYLMLGILFLITAGHTFKYLFSGDEEAQKKAIRIIIFAIVGCLSIILSKTLVELVYGPYETIVQGEALQVTPWGLPGSQNVWNIGLGVIDSPALGDLYIAINRILWLGTIILVWLIIYIGYLMLFQPTSEEATGKITRAITRWLGGILVMGAAYLIANFVIIK